MDIAIIGLSGRFPQANSIDEFYRNLEKGNDAVRPVSDKRIDDTGIPRKRYREYAYLEDIDKFDHDFFDISLGEAKYIDPHQRILLEEVYHAIENAGYNVDHLAGSRTSVYIGDTNQNYYELTQESNPLLLTGNLNATTAGRIARQFNFLGNALMVDTACSSSLVALHLACNDLKLGDSELAIVGGVNIILMYAEEDEVDESGIASADARCKTFSASANGTGSGEAACCIIIKPLSKALQDNDYIHAVIKSTAVNQDARRSSSLTAPSSEAQAEVISATWKKAAINPENIGYIEVHGTGTQLGDPIEIDGITRAFAMHTMRKQFCAVSSLKTNIGHTDSAAGLSGLIKTVLSIDKGVLFPSLHFDHPNPFIDFLNSPVYVNAVFRQWNTSPAKRLAGISSFGISGTNCHALIEGNDKKNTVSDEKGNDVHLVTVSAKSLHSLKENINALKQFITQPQSHSLSDISYTLNVGRKHYPLRFACMIRSKDELHAALNEFVPSPEPCEQNWFLFSDTMQIDDSYTGQFIDRFPTLKQLYTSAISEVKEINAVIKKILFQFSMAKFYEQMGVPPIHVIGNGTGKIVVDLLKGTIGINDLSSRLTDYQKEASTELPAKLGHFIRTKLSNKNSVVIELGPAGELFSGLVANDYDPSHIHLFDLKDDKAFLTSIKFLYQSGTDIVFPPLYNNKTSRRLPLPGYRFERTRCWMIPFGAGRSAVRDWFYQLRWSNDPLSDTAMLPEGKTFLVLLNSNVRQEDFCRDMEKQGVKLIKIYADRIQVGTPQFYQTGKSIFENIGANLEQEKLSLDGIIDLAFISGSTHTQTEFSTDQLSIRFLLLKVLINCLQHDDFKLIYLSSGSHEIEKGEAVNPMCRAVEGFYHAFQSQYPMIDVRCIDVAAADQLNVITLMQEIAAKSYPGMSAYRKGKRFTKQFAKKDFASHPQQENVFRENGIYLITGGLGGIGLQLARHLADQCRCKIILIGRKEIPPKENWRKEMAHPDRQIGSALRELINIEEGGSEIFYYAADVSDRSAMTAVFEDIQYRFTSINGIVHAAGTMGPRIPFQDLSFDDFQETQKAKIQGTNILDDLSRTYKLDFFVLFSSLNTVVPQADTVDYNPANAFQDGYAQYLRQKGVNAIAINWGAWGEVGAGNHIDVSSQENQNAHMRAWSTRDGLSAFDIALQIAEANIIVANLKTNAFGINPFFNVINITQAPPAQIQSYNPPDGSSQTEIIIAKIWFEVLLRYNLGLDDNFFELGGHSLLAKRVINQITAKLGTQISFKNIYEYPTIKTLAGYIDKGGTQDPAISMDHIEPLLKSHHYEVSPGQREIWLVQQFDDKNISYNVTQEFLLSGKLDRNAFYQSIRNMVIRHEVFRTTYAVKDGQVMQSIKEYNDNCFDFSFVDLTAVEDQSAEIEKAIHFHLTTPFNLKEGPILRVHLMLLSQDEYLFLFATHHINYDNWSAYIILEEIIRTYAEIKSSGQASDYPLTIQYKEYANWLNKKLQDERTAGRYKKFWLDQLKGTLPVLNFPADRPRPGVKTFRGDSVFFSLDKSTSDIMKRGAQKQGGSLFMSLLSVLNILIYKYTGQRDIIVGTPVSTREHEQFENQIGFFINLLPLRTSLEETDSFNALFEKIKNRFLQIMDHKIYPFEYITRSLNLKQDPSRSPLFDILIVVNNNYKTGEVSLKQEFEVKEYQTSTINARYDLVFEFNDTSTAIEASIVYNSDLFDRSSVELIKERLITVCQFVTLNATSKIEDVDLRLSSEKIREKKILETLNIQEQF